MKIKHLSIYIFLVVLFFSCEKADPVIPNEEELITTLTYILQPVQGGDAIELKFKDLDGDGGVPPEITTAPLSANTTYSGTLVLLNELDTPPVDITEEVNEEAEEHQVFYETTLAGLGITYADEDLNGNPIGVVTEVTTLDAGNGELKVILRHLPQKPNDGTAADAGGETDIEVTFTVVIE